MRRMVGLFWIWTSFSAGSAEVDGPPRVCVWWRAGAEREVGSPVEVVELSRRGSIEQEAGGHGNAFVWSRLSHLRCDLMFTAMLTEPSCPSLSSKHPPHFPFII